MVTSNFEESNCLDLKLNSKFQTNLFIVVLWPIDTCWASIEVTLDLYLLRSFCHSVVITITQNFSYMHFFIFFSAEEMACLATWKEGSSRYFVSMLNHSHVYTDETRYRCFVYQRQHSNELDRVTYKMAQSLYASCLGLWNVNEGHKTFTMTKCKLLFIFLLYC